MVALGYNDTELKKLGAFHTAKEINNQPDLWLKIYDQILDDRNRITDFLNDAISQVNKIILTGAGTSAFIGLSLQGTFFRNLKTQTVSIATTDLVSHPDDYFCCGEPVLLVSFARSGNSPESIAAVSLADDLCKKCFHLIITCDPKGQLSNYQSKFSKHKIILPPETNDKGLAMTSSYSGMLLSGLLIARIFEIENLKNQVTTLYNYGKLIIDKYGSRLEEIVNNDFTRAIFLGSGPQYGTGVESQLKLQELTDGAIVCKNDSYLGFRHGPKAVTNEKTLLVFIFSNVPYVQLYERDLVNSMKKGKRALFTIGIFESPINDLKFELNIQLSDTGKQLDEEFLTVCNILPGQLLGFYKSISMGLKPDTPSESGAISRVVEDVKIYLPNHSI